MPRLSDKFSSESDTDTGLPGLRSWRAVYVFVCLTFVVWLGLLTWLTRHYA